MSKEYGNGAGGICFNGQEEVLSVQRDIFLQMCQRVSILESGICGIKENVPDELKVIYNEIAYYPVAYELGFNAGQPTHRAILHDLKANSITHADLSRVDKQKEK